MDGLRIFVNDRWIEPATPYGAPALDFIRGELGLTGTKEGCREGDCGACAVLVGEMTAPGAARYRALPSCLLALGELDGKHLITIEGLAAGAANAEANAMANAEAKDGLTPVMRAFLEENASQCGFCSPGFVIALTAWLASPGKPDVAGAMTAVDGNLCRCTGYGAIRRAAERLAVEFADLPQGEAARIAALVERGVLPASALAYAAEAGERPRGRRLERRLSADASQPATALGGGTDFYVRTPDPAGDFRPILLRSAEGFSGIEAVERNGQAWLRAGAAVSVSDFFASPLVRRAAPGIEAFEGDFASSLIRNLATLGGNIANASPVGDLTSMLIGLGAALEIAVLAPDAPASGARYVRIEEFFLGYKKIDVRAGEAIRAILIPAGRDGSPLLFSFEKIAKRKKLDIAAVNTALSFRVEGGFARGARLSAGGVAAMPALLEGASAALEGERVDRSDPAGLARLARKVAEAAEAEVKPISDVRGSTEYRRRMTGRLVLAHFVRLFAADGIAKELFP